MTDIKTDKILIVDDESDIAVILRLHLEEAGYTTSWAADGESGLSLLQSGNYALVLLDVRMPGINGVEVLQRIRKIGLDTAVIMMTAHGNENLVTECMKAGAADYVAKPFDAEDLLNRIERAIGNRRAQLEKLRFEKEKDDFFFMLSHDLKNPITAALGSIDIMREGRLGPINAEQEDYLQSAIESCEEIIAMIDNLLDLKRFESETMQPRIKSADPQLLITALIKRFTPAAERENIKLTFDAGQNVPEVAVDTALMTRVLANILTNAFKFTPEEGSITLSCSCVENSDLHRTRIPVYAAIPPGFSDLDCLVRISIKDTGNGIPSKDLNIIFNQYVQSHSSVSRVRGGAGLGLAFCKLTIESFHGCIWAESENGEGSEFIILLPGHPGNGTCDQSISENIS
jgi:signal transduction histidine kinase